MLLDLPRYLTDATETHQDDTEYALSGIEYRETIIGILDYVRRDWSRKMVL
jgi:hypothetical protein